MTKRGKVENDIANAFDFLRDIVKTPSKLDKIKNGNTIRFVDDSHADDIDAEEGVTYVKVKREFEITH